MKRFLVGLCLFFFLAASWTVGAWDQIDYQRLMATKKCVKCDLTEANLTRTIFCETKMPDGTINNSGC